MRVLFRQLQDEYDIIILLRMFQRPRWRQIKLNIRNLTRKSLVKSYLKFISLLRVVYFQIYT